MANWMLARAKECRSERDRLLVEAAAARAIATDIMNEVDAMEREAAGIDQLINVLDPRGRAKR